MVYQNRDRSWLKDSYLHPFRHNKSLRDQLNATTGLHGAGGNPAVDAVVRRVGARAKSFGLAAGCFVGLVVLVLSLLVLR